MIKYIIFDLGGVVIFGDDKKIQKAITGYIGVEQSRFEQVTADQKLRVLTGEISLYQLYQIVLERLAKNHLDPQNVLERHIQVYRESYSDESIDEEMLAMIERLKRNYGVVCLTNTEPEIAALNWKERPILFTSFQRAYLSTEMGLAKPDQRIYKAVLDDLKARPEEVVFVDDKQENLSPAEAMGMKVILFSNRVQLEKDLHSLGIQIK